MNRPPQLADPWFLQHQNTCGGNFVKISGPANRRNNAEPSKNDLSNGDFPGNNTASSPAKYTLLHYWKLKGKGIRLGSSNELPLGFPKSESLLQENDEAIEKRGNFIDLTLEGD